MNTRSIAVACALTAAACSNDKPPRDPSISSTTVQPPPNNTINPSAMTEPAVASTPASGPTDNGTIRPFRNGHYMNKGGVTAPPGASEQEPMDQGTATETKITATIRRGMMADKSLSTTAKNAAVITVGTKVTLRGTVQADDERSTIESLARQTAGVTDVDDQLEVKK